VDSSASGATSPVRPGIERCCSGRRVELRKVAGSNVGSRKSCRNSSDVCVDFGWITALDFRLVCPGLVAALLVALRRPVFRSVAISDKPQMYRALSTLSIL